MAFAEIIADVEGVRADAYLANKMPDVSRSHLQRLIKEGTITLNSKVCQPSTKLRMNDVLRYDEDALHPRVLPEDIEIHVLYEDDDIIVIDKPAGLVVHPNAHSKSGTLVNALIAHCDDAFGDMLDADERPGIVHRLDKDTSGVLIVAKNLDACEKLKDDFKEHRVHKTYLTLLKGVLSPKDGDIRLPIGRDARNKSRMAVVEQGGKDAWTEYKTIAARQGVSLVKIRLHTGRTHQIRVHCAYMKHPVIGDTVYDKHADDAPVSAPRQMLHAWKITFAHPRTGKKMQFVSPVPADFLEATSILQLSQETQNVLTHK